MKPRAPSANASPVAAPGPPAAPAPPPAAAEPAVPAGAFAQPRTMTVQRAQEWSGLSRSAIYRAIAAKHLQAVKHGRQTLIVADSLRRYLDNLPAASIGGLAA